MNREMASRPTIVILDGDSDAGYQSARVLARFGRIDAVVRADDETLRASA